MSYEGVLFDLDNTLVDRAGAVVRIAQALYDAEPTIRANTPREAAVDRIVELDADGMAGRKVLMERVQEEWPDIARGGEELVAWYGARYVTSLEEDALVQALVAGLSRAGMPWGIVTNGPSSKLSARQDPGPWPGGTSNVCRSLRRARLRVAGAGDFPRGSATTRFGCGQARPIRRRQSGCRHRRCAGGRHVHGVGAARPSLA